MNYYWYEIQAIKMSSTMPVNNPRNQVKTKKIPTVKEVYIGLSIDFDDFTSPFTHSYLFTP